MKIGYLAAILKRYKYFIFFPRNMVVISVYIYCIKIIKKFRWESGFLKGVPWNPLMHYTNRSAGYLMQLSVNLSKAIAQGKLKCFLRAALRYRACKSYRLFSCAINYYTVHM